MQTQSPYLALSLVGSLALAHGCVADVGDVATSQQALAPNALVERIDDRVTFGGAQPSLTVSLAVRSSAGDLEVGIRASVDGGAWFDVEGSLASDLPGARELWEVTVTPEQAWSSIRYAAYYQDSSTGAEAWDNFDGQDFFVQSKPDVQQASHSYDDGTLSIDISVRNRVYDKSCAALVTGDDWLSLRYAPAYWVESLEHGYERWRVDLSVADGAWYYVSQAASIRYALVCFFGSDWIGTWDNNQGDDFRFDRGWGVVDQQIDNGQRASLVALAATGERLITRGTYYYSSRTLEFQDAEGEVVSTLELDETIRDVVWVDEHDMFLVRTTTSSWPNYRWIAFDTDATELWRLDAPLENYVEARGDVKGDAFLTGNAGGAIVSRELPTVIGPGDDQRCFYYPLVSAGGRLLCGLSSGTEAYDLNGDVEQKPTVYPSGQAWAVSDDGYVVIRASNTLQGYDDKAELLWERDIDYAPRHYPRGRGYCANYVKDGAFFYTNHLYRGDDSSHITYGIDLATGEENFALDAEYGDNSPCVYPDGELYFMRSAAYDEYLFRLTTGGEIDASYQVKGRFDLVRIDANSLVSVSVLPRIESPQTEYNKRAVILDSDLVERFARSTQVANPGVPLSATQALPYIAVATDNQLEVVEVELPEIIGVP